MQHSRNVAASGVRRRVREQSDRETFSPAILHFRGSRYHDHHSLARSIERYHDKRAHTREYISKSIERARILSPFLVVHTWPFETFVLLLNSCFEPGGDNVRCNDTRSSLTASPSPVELSIQAGGGKKLDAGSKFRNFRNFRYFEEDDYDRGTSPR